MNNPKNAFLWIIERLEMYSVPFQIAGGLAARIYGSRGPLNDIDIYIPMECFSAIRDGVERHVTWGSEHYREDVSDIRRIG